MSYSYIHWKEDDRGAVAVGSDSSCFTVTDGVLTDYLANDLGVRLCSESMRNAIEDFAPGACEWSEATVIAAGKANRYFVLEACESMTNYLSALTKRTDLCIIKAVLDRRANPIAPILQVEDGGMRWAVHASVIETSTWQALTGVELTKVAEH
jgi:hypothetical protein